VPAAAPQGYVPAAAWANVGADNPAKAIQTFFWAGKQGETNLVNNLLRWQRDTDIPVSDKLDDMFAQALISGTTRFSREMQGFRITSQQEEGNEARLGVEWTNQNGKTELHTLRLVREDNKWFPVMHLFTHGGQAIRASMDVPPKFQALK